MSQPTSGMKLQNAAVEQAILGIQGDLIAIQFLREHAKRMDGANLYPLRIWLPRPCMGDPAHTKMWMPMS